MYDIKSTHNLTYMTFNKRILNRDFNCILIIFHLPDQTLCYYLVEVHFENLKFQERKVVDIAKSDLSLLYCTGHYIPIYANIISSIFIRYYTNALTQAMKKQDMK